MTKRVVITRALPEAQATARRVRDRRCIPVLAPLLTIVPCGYNTSLEGAQALLFTSSNGVRAFPDIRGAQGLVVLAVGDATAAAAREAGHKNVLSADGDVRSLAELARRQLKPGGGKLIHIGGSDVAGDLAGELSTEGFKVERRVAYAARPAAEPPEALAVPFEVILFHSARAASVYIGFGAPNSAAAIAACISQTVADAASAVPWGRLVVAPQPREDALLDAALSA